MNDCCLFVSRTLPNLERCPGLSRTCSCWWASFSAQRWTHGIRDFFAFFILSDCRVDSRLVTITLPLAHLVQFFCGFPHGGVVGFKDVRKSRYSFHCSCVLRTVSHLFPSCIIHLCAWLKRGICSLVHIEFCVKTLHLGTVSVLHGHRFCRDTVVVLIASIAIWIPDVLFLSYLKLETGDLRDLKYGVNRVIGSGATVQSVSRCLLVVKRAIPLFRVGMKKLQRWNHLSSE